MKAIIVKSTLVILLLIYFAALISCKSESAQENEVTLEQKPVAVRTEAIIRKPMALPVRTRGVLASSEESKLSFKTGGIIRVMSVNEGQSVRRNQVLAQLDLSEINSQVTRAEAAFDKARRDLERMNNLYREKVVTLETLENATTAFDLAQSDLEIASFNQRFSTITAPANGKVLTKFAEVNELVNPGTAVFLFASHEASRVVKVGLVDKEIIKLHSGDSATVQFDALPDRQFVARISRMDQAPDPVSATYEVEVVVDNMPVNVLDGFFAEVNIFPSAKNDYTFIPVDAIAEANERVAVVYTLQGDRAKRHQIIVDRIIGDHFASAGTLEGASVVITDGVHELDDESVIQVHNHPEEDLLASMSE